MSNFLFRVGQKWNSRILTFLLFYISFLSTSPLWFSLGGSGVITYLLLLPFALVLNDSFRYNKYVMLFIILVFSTALIPAFYWMDYRFILYPFFLIISIIIVSSADKEAIFNYINISTWFFLIILFGCWLGFILYLKGFGPIWHVVNPDGRLNYLFISTFSNIFLEGFMRPSGIYDEPGTLAFFLAFIIYVRLLFNLNSRLTVLLLFLGIITFSYAYFVFSVLVLISMVNKSTVFTLLVAILLSLLTLYQLDYFQLFDTYLLGRVSNGVQEDGRFVLFNNALFILKSSPLTILFGLHPSCIFNIEVCKNIGGYFSENPLAPLVATGIFGAWIYYFYLLFTVLSLFSFSRAGFLLFCFGLQFLQRPNVMTHGYSLIAVLSVWLFIKVIKERNV
jgi:hypothetical protein